MTGWVRLKSADRPALYHKVVPFLTFLTCLSLFLVERRQKLVMKKAMQTSAIVSSLFPANVRDRLLRASTASSDNGNGGADPLGMSRSSTSYSQKVMLGGDDIAAEDDICSAPIADLFPHCTVCFADIAGTCSARLFDWLICCDYSFLLLSRTLFILMY